MLPGRRCCCLIRGKGDQRRVWMGIFNVTVVDGDGYPLLFRCFKACADSRVPGSSFKIPPTMALSVPCPLYVLAKDPWNRISAFATGAPKAGQPFCRYGQHQPYGSWKPDHNRADNIKYIHGNSPIPGIVSLICLKGLKFRISSEKFRIIRKSALP